VNIEELKLVMGLIKDLSDGAQSAFAWWLVASYGAHLLQMVLLAGTVLGLAYIITRTILKVNAPTRRSRLDAARDAVRDLWLYGSSSYESSDATTFHEMYMKLKGLSDTEERTP
jgi:hypothetical protein